MANHSDPKQKVINALKGIITSFKLIPFGMTNVDPSLKDGYLSTTIENVEGKSENLVFRTSLYDQLLDLAEKLYPGQLDDDLVSQFIIKSLKLWNKTKRDESNINQQLEKFGEDFICDIENAIQPLKIFLPMEGLQIIGCENLTFGNCIFYENHANSEFMQVVRREQQDNNLLYLEEAEMRKIKSYVTYQVTAHAKRAMKRGIEEANLALSVLRLYIASYYEHENNRKVPTRMGIYGSLHKNEPTFVFYIDSTVPINEYLPGSRMSLKPLHPFQITCRNIKVINENGLSQINHLMGPAQEKNDIARRLRRAITWFAKATYANSKTESYLMYAMAIEGLLSEDRTSQEAYALEIASLVTCDKKDCLIYPIGGGLSNEFFQSLEMANSLGEKFNVIREKALKLFTHRNRIAHGAVLENDLKDDIDLLDFETLVRNSILAFAKRQWSDFSSFKKWMKESVRYDFNPKSQKA